MPDLAHLDLNKDVAPPPPGRRGSWRLVLVALVVIGAVALVAALVLRSRTAAPENVRIQSEDTVVPEPSSGNVAKEPGEDIALGPLDETDGIVRDLVGRLSSHPKVLAWLATDQLIRNFTVSVVNISNGHSPAQHLERLNPTGGFLATTTGTVSYIDPRSYRRYDDYADAVAGIDARGAARLYATLKPRIQDAAAELGQPDRDFDVTLERAIVELLRVPVVEGSVAVVPAPVFWAYADPRLESLSGAQRQLLRSGPRNVQIIQAKLREIAPYLGIAPERLPAPTVIRFPQAQ